MNRKHLKTAGKILIFFIIINLPYLTITHLIGLESFVNTFEEPETYKYLKFTPETSTPTYLLIQKPKAQDYTIQSGDQICYITHQGTLEIEQVCLVNTQTPAPKYYTLNAAAEPNEESIFEYQIIGKVITTIDNNIWTTLSLKVWDMSRHNLNAVTLLLKK